MGWIDDLGNVYEKEVINEQIVRGSVAPTERPNLTYRNNKLGIVPNNLAADSLAGNVQFGNPYEQEEEISDIDKILKEIDVLMSDLDESSPTDRVAIMVLGKLKNKIS
jgi:hypothetical protein